MESYRRRDRMTVATRHAQAGMTALGFVILALLVGVVGLAVLKLTPMYLKNMRMSQILEDVETELGGQSPTPITIRQEFGKRFAIEDVNLDTDTVKITQSKDGYSVRITYEERARYIADIYLVVAFDKQVEIQR